MKCDKIKIILRTLTCLFVLATFMPTRFVILVNVVICICISKKIKYGLIVVFDLRNHAPQNLVIHET